jgi:hypothetical protein
MLVDIEHLCFMHTIELDAKWISHLHFSPHPLPFIVHPGLVLHHIKRGFRTEPAGLLGANSLISKGRILLLDLYRLPPAPAGSRISKQLRMTTLFQTNEPEDGRLDGLPAGQETMVLKQCGFLGAEGFGNSIALVCCEDNALEGVVDCEVIVEGARILRDGIETPAEGAEGAAVDAVGMGDTVDIWTCCVHRVVDHIRWGGCVVSL